MAGRAKTPRTGNAAGTRPPKPKRTEDYRYPEKRPNNPEAGLQSFDRKVPKKVRYEYDPHLDPQLVWASKAEHTSFGPPRAQPREVRLVFRQLLRQGVSGHTLADRDTEN